MRILGRVSAVAVLVLVLACGAFSQTGKPLSFAQYGLAVTLPADSAPVALGDIGGGGMQAAYTSNGLAYIIIATNDVQPRGMGARAAIEMQIEMMNVIKSKVPSIPIHMLSATTSQGVAVKGFGISGPVINGKSAYSRVPDEIRSMFGNEVAASMLLVPIVDRPALAGAVVVVGPASRGSEVDSQATLVAGTIVISKPTLPLYSGKQKGSKNGEPAGPEIKPINQLKKGQIELVGVVKTTDASMKCVDMLVSQAVPFGGHGATLSPPRLKRVYVKEIAKDVTEGAVIIVVAKDTGPGRSVDADTLTVMDMSKMGF